MLRSVALACVLLVPAAALAAPEPGATAARIEAVIAGKESITAMIDPAAGFAIRDSRGTMRACGASVALFADAIERAVRDRYEPDVTCRRRKGRTQCLLQLPQPTGTDDPNFALVFRDGPVLDGAVWKDQVTGSDAERAIRRAPRTCPVVPVAPPAADPPADPDRPRAVTRSLLRRLASGQTAFDPLIDPVRGVELVSFFTGEGDTIARSKRLCGAEAIKSLDASRAQMRKLIDIGDRFVCHNRPAPATCDLFEAGEFAGGIRYQFRTTATGLVLETAVTLNSTYRALDVESQVARLRARVAGGCDHSGGAGP